MNKNLDRIRHQNREAASRIEVRRCMDALEQRQGLEEVLGEHTAYFWDCYLWWTRVGKMRALPAPVRARSDNQ